MERRAAHHSLTRKGSLGAFRCKSIEQISYRKQKEAKNSAPEIQEMTCAMPQPPMHPRKEVKCFANMSNDNRNKTCRTE
jgi:hypothetical protein